MTSDRAALAHVIRRRMYFITGLMVVIFVPFMVIIALPNSGNLLTIALIEGLFGGMIAFFAGVGYMAVRRSARTPATVTTVTTRRVIVQHFGKDPAPSVIFLESVGRVELNQHATSRRFGVAWLYVLPQGVPTVMVGAGKSRHVASGVLWVPAVPQREAEVLRDLITAEAQRVQAAFAMRPQAPTTV